MQHSLSCMLLELNNYSTFLPNWTAPEVLEGRNLNEFSDVYSFGMILYELLTRKVPYSSDEDPNWQIRQYVEKAICKGIRPTYRTEQIHQLFNVEVPTRIFNILIGCWNENSSKRPTFHLLANTFYVLLQPIWTGVGQLMDEMKGFLPYQTLSQMWEPILEKKSETVTQFQTLEDIKKERELTTSQFGGCFVCQIRNWKGFYVMKELYILKQLNVNNAPMNELKTMERILYHGGHPNLVRLLGYYQDPNRIILIMEYFQEGSLDSVLSRRIKAGDYFSSAELVDFAFQILSGLKFLHQHKIAHRAVKVREKNKKIFFLF